MPKNTYRRFLIVILVFFSYVFIGISHFNLGNLSNKPTTHYQYLTAAFLMGHLSLPIVPSPQLLTLKDPYDPLLNKKFKFHDASLYNGKYFLYFGPLPVLSFYLPFKLLSGVYPSDGLAVLFFMGIGFIFQFVLLIKIKDKFFPNVPEPQLLLAGTLLGFANNGPFLLSNPRVYEAAIAAAFATVSASLLFLFQFITDESKCKNIFFFSLFFSLAVAARPHFVLVEFILVPALFIFMLRQHYSNIMLCLINLFLPMLAIGSALGIYNYLRFNSPFEFGLHYQLNFFNTFKESSFPNPKHLMTTWLAQIFYYFFQPRLSMPILLASSPHYIYEATKGIFLSTPIVVMLFGMPSVMMNYFKKEDISFYPLLTYTFMLLWVPVVIFLFLASLLVTSQRYETDFLPYLILLSVITFWLITNSASPKKWLSFLQMFFLLAALGSIFLNLSISFSFYRIFIFHSFMIFIINSSIYLYGKGFGILHINFLPLLIAAFYLIVRLLQPYFYQKK